MIKEIFATGSDVNAAIDSGCLLLGIDRADAQFEIIDLPRKRFLGLKKLPAKVRVYLELPDAAPARPAAQPASRPAQNPARPAQPAAPKAAQPATKPAQSAAPAHAPDAQPGEGKPKRKRDRHRKNRDARPEDAAIAQPIVPEELRVEIEPTDEVRAKAEKARVYVSGILTQMGFAEIEIKPFFYEENVRLQLGGERLGSVIGRRGETLDALQYLASLVANKGEGSYLRINIDSGNYREKRERTLEALARKLASNAVKSGRSITLEPMNPYERRIIHGTVSAMKGVTSSSIGVEPNRKVVITPDGSVAPAVTDGERTSPERTGGSGSSGSRGGRGRGGHGGRGGHSGGERPAGDRGARPERTERGGRRDDPPAIGGPVRRELPQERPEKSLEEKALTETSKLYGKIDL